MKHEALASAITGIEEDLLQEAITAPPAPRHPAFGRWSAMAAASISGLYTSLMIGSPHEPMRTSAGASS